jgi:hypothetical protein
MDLSLMKRENLPSLNRSENNYRRYEGRKVFVPPDIFEKYAEDYDRWFDEHREEYLSELARIRRLLPAPGPRSIEMGVGSGRFAASLGVTLGVEPSWAHEKEGSLSGSFKVETTLKMTLYRSSRLSRPVSCEKRLPNNRRHPFTNLIPFSCT